MIKLFEVGECDFIPYPMSLSTIDVLKPILNPIVA